MTHIHSHVTHGCESCESHDSWVCRLSGCQHNSHASGCHHDSHVSGCESKCVDVSVWMWVDVSHQWMWVDGCESCEWMWIMSECETCHSHDSHHCCHYHHHSWMWVKWVDVSHECVMWVDVIMTPCVTCEWLTSMRDMWVDVSHVSHDTHIHSHVTQGCESWVCHVSGCHHDSHVSGCHHDSHPCVTCDWLKSMCEWMWHVSGCGSWVNLSHDTHTTHTTAATITLTHGCKWMWVDVSHEWIWVMTLTRLKPLQPLSPSLPSLSLISPPCHSHDSHHCNHVMALTWLTPLMVIAAAVVRRNRYGVATIRRLLKITGHFCRI